MTFFNFQNSQGGGSSSSSSSDNSTSSDSSGSDPPVVSNQFWIYWAVTIPLTIVIVLCWYIWEQRREKRYVEEDTAIEKGVESMEIQIQREMRERTLSKAATWDTITTGG